MFRARSLGEEGGKASRDGTSLKFSEEGFGLFHRLACDDAPSNAPSLIRQVGTAVKKKAIKI